MSTRKGSHRARPSKRIPGAVVVPPVSPDAAARRSRRFLEGDPQALCVGPVSLETFLRDTPLAWVLDLDTQLRTTDWAPFDPGPRPGRMPFHPRVRVGLIVYGMLRSQWSLRALETLAATDMGAWWICGGLRPDHRTLGDFITAHAGGLRLHVLGVAAVALSSFHLRPTATTASIGPEYAAGTRLVVFEFTGLRRRASKLFRVQTPDGATGYAFLAPNELSGSCEP